MGDDKKAPSGPESSHGDGLPSELSDEVSARQPDPHSERNSMADLEQELAELLDDAPLLPDDDDEESDVDFVPPPGVFQRNTAGDATLSSSAAELRPERHQTGDDAPPQLDSVASSIDSDAPDQSEVIPKATGTKRGGAIQPSEPRSRAKTARSKRKQRRRSAEPYRPIAEPASERMPAKDAEVASKSGARWYALLAVGGLLLAAAWLVSQAVSRSPSPPPAPVSNPPLARQVVPPTPSTVEPPPSSSDAGRAQHPVREVEPSPSRPATQAEDEPPEPTASATATAFDAVKVLTALAPAGIQASRCRRTGDPKGKVYAQVVIGKNGEIESVFSGNTYRGTATEECIERKLRAARLPSAAAGGGEVVLPIELR